MQASAQKLFKESDLVIFDLDGTLIDSSQDLALAVNVALESIGMKPWPVQEIKQMIGNGARELVRKALGYKEELFRPAFKVFSEHYSKNLLTHTKLYPGALEVLKKLKSKKMAVLSNKRQTFCDPIIEGLKIKSFFQWVYGGDRLPEKKPSPVPIEHILNEAHVKPAQGLILGDSSIDIEAGKLAKIKTIGFYNGFCSKEEVKDANPDLLVSHFEELLSFFG
jgi:phosphoglycolate phosphatase